jgi:hypothetical protein
MLFATLHSGSVDIGESGNLFGEQAIPELPTETASQVSGDGAAAAAVLALDGDETKHG